VWRFRACGQRVRLLGAGAIVWIAICAMAPHAWGQDTPVGGAKAEPPAPATGAPSALPSAGVAIGSYPLELLGLLAPAAQRGPFTLLPSIAVSEEYNDNLLLDNLNRQSDFITGFSPALMLFVNRPSYRLTAGYSSTAELYQRESRFDNALSRQNFILNGSYEGTRGLTFAVSDAFARDRSTNVVATQGFASGRQEAWSNSFSPGVSWQMTPATVLNVVVTHAVERFEGTGVGFGSDTYGLQNTLGHVLTPRLTGTVGYGFTYLNLLGQQQNSTTHTPTFGASYRLTPTLTASVNGGPAVTQIGGETFVSAAATAGLVQVLRYGSASAQYSRSVGVAGGLGGTTETQTFSGALALLTWQRGLIVTFNPSYSTAKSVSRGQTGPVDANALTLNLGASYQIARYASIFGGYRFFQQRTQGSTTTQFDSDQNLVRFGVQFGYPFNFD